MYHFKLTCSFHCSLIHSPQHNEHRRTFCTKGDSLHYIMSEGTFCSRAICPGEHSAVGQYVWGNIVHGRNLALKTKTEISL